MRSSWAMVYRKLLNFVVVVNFVFSLYQRQLRWPSKLDAFRRQKMCGPQSQEGIWATPALQYGTHKDWHRTGNLVSSGSINSFHRITKWQEMQIHLKIVWCPSYLHTVICQHRVITELMNTECYCPEKKCLRKVTHQWWSDSSVQLGDSCECGDSCVLLIRK